MNGTKTLLIELHHPGLEEPLRLMSGPGFSALRTDITGRDIYGYAHEDKEYLLVPFSFAQSGPNTLDMNIPSSYKEWFMDMAADDARIQFTTPRGEHFFDGMPEEYQSCSGRVRFDECGGISVVMDKAALPRRAAACACAEARLPEKNGGAHEHGGAHSCGGHEPHQHGPGVRLQASMSDPERAEDIRKQAEVLNLLLQQAAAVGLEAHLSLTVNPGSGNAPDCPQISVPKIARLL